MEKETGKKRWSRLGASGWRHVLARQASSGLSVAEFCRREEVSRGSFFRWRALLAERPAEGVAAPDGFMDLGVLGGMLPRGPVAQSAGRRLELKLDLGGGIVLHLVRD